MSRASGTISRLLLIVAAGVATLVVLPTPEVARAAPAIRLSPSTGPVGTRVTVTGTGFAPGFPPCEVRFGIDATKPRSMWGGSVVATCTVDAKGALSAAFTVPTANLGAVTVGVCNFCTGGEFVETALATFTVTAAPPTTVPPTTVPTTVPPSTSTVAPTDASTTTTTIPTSVPPRGTLPDLVDGSAVADLGPLLGGDRWRPISVVDGLIEFPERWLERCAAPPEATTVDFDDRPLGSSMWTLSAPGVEPQVQTSWPLGIVAPEHGTWSAPHAGSTVVRDQRMGGSQQFTSFGEGAGFTYFGLRVGLARDQGGPVVLELTGWSRGTARAIDVDRVQLGPERVPATTCLIVAAPRGTKLSEVYLSVYTPDEAPAQVLFDGIFWSHDRAYPLDQPASVAVEIVMPAEGRRLSTSRTTTVVGRVTWPTVQAAPFVNVAVPTWDRTGLLIRRAVLGRPVRNGPDSTAVFWVQDVRVPSGPFQIDASATSPYARGSASVQLEGIGPPTPPPDQYRELLSDRVDVVPWAIEVTQAIRGPLEVQAPESVVDDDFLHVAGKPTWVRGYGVHRFDAAALGIRPGRLQVDAVLHGTRHGVTLPLSPLHPNQAGVPLLVAEPGTAAEELTRPFTGLTWNFQLPSEWTTGDPIELRLEVNPPTSPFFIGELPDAGGSLNTIGRRVEFTDVGRVGLSVLNVDLHWRCTTEMIENERHPCAGLAEGDRVSAVHDTATLSRVVRDWWGMWPASGTFPAYMLLGGISLPHKPDAELTVDQQVSGRFSATSWETWRDAYYDVYCDGDLASVQRVQTGSFRDMIWMTQPWWSPIGVGGCAWNGAPSAFLSGAFVHALAQEAGHTTGLVHTSTAHGERRGGSASVRFSGDHGQLGSPSAAEWGFDTRAGVVIDPRVSTDGHVHDLMSYGGGRTWVSVSTWNHLVRSFAGNRALLDTRGALVGRSQASSAAPEGASEAASVEGWMVVEGQIEADGTVSVSAPRLVAPGAVLSTPGDEVVLTWRDATGVVLGEITVGTQSTHTHSQETSRGFTALVPVMSKAQSLVVEVDGAVAAEVTGTGGAVSIIESRLAEGRLQVAWSGAAVASSSIVEASQDGDAWWPIAYTDESSTDVDLGSLPFAGSGWRLRVQSTDGVGVSASEVTVDFGQPSPQAAIAAPVADERVREGMVDVAAARATIGTDTATYTWLVDGEAISEGAVAAVPVPAGPHTLTLRVEAAGVVDEVSIDVIGVVDTDGDGLDDGWEEQYGFDPIVYDDSSLDRDSDALADGNEYVLGTDPQAADSDGDGYPDGGETQAGSDPLDDMSIPGPQHGLDDHGVGHHDDGGGGQGLPLWMVISGVALLLALLTGGGSLVARARHHRRSSN